MSNTKGQKNTLKKNKETVTNIEIPTSITNTEEEKEDNSEEQTADSKRKSPSVDFVDKIIKRKKEKKEKK